MISAEDRNYIYLLSQSVNVVTALKINFPSLFLHLFCGDYLSRHLERVRGVPPLRADHPGEAEGGGAAVGQHGLQKLGGQQGGHRDTEAWSPLGW